MRGAKFNQTKNYANNAANDKQVCEAFFSVFLNKKKAGKLVVSFFFEVFYFACT